MGRLGPDLRARAHHHHYHCGSHWPSRWAHGWSSCPFLCPEPRLSYRDPLDSLKNTRLRVHNLQTLSSQYYRKFPETPQHYLILGSCLWVGLFSFFNHESWASIPSGNTQKNPLDAQRGLGGVVISSASNYWFWLQNQELLTTNPLEQGCPKILSAKRRAMCSEQGIQRHSFHGHVVYV